jgi:GAF domain-containing protein
MVAQGWQISLDQKQSLVARAARMRTGIIVNDVRQDPTWLPNHLLPHTRSEMAVPLLAGERVIGVLDVQSDQVDHFTADDIQIQSALATQVAVSLENARLFEETQATLAETAHLYQANRRINEVSDLTEMMAVIAETSHVPALNQLYLATFEHGPAGEVENLIVTANWFGGQGTPPPPVGTRFSVAAMPYKNLLFTLEPVFINDVLQDERLDFGAVAAIQEERIQSMAILPMWVSNRQIGVLLLKAASPHNFSKPEERLYASLARQVAVAVENQRLLAETQSAVAELEATQRRYTIQAWDAFRNRNVALRYEQTREQTNTPVVGLSATTKESTEPGIANGGQLPEPVGENSVSKDGQLPNVQNELVVPLKVRDQVIGVLGMQELFDTRRWTPEEMDLVEAIAEQIAQAAENLRLIDETQQTAAREARVNEIGEKIQSAQSLEEALRIAVREVGVSLQVPQTAVQLKVVN